MKISQIILEELNGLDELNEFGFMNAARSFVRGFRHPNDDYFARPDPNKSHFAYDPTISGYNKNSNFSNAWDHAKSMFNHGLKNINYADQNYQNQQPDYERISNEGYKLGYNQLGASARQAITGAANSLGQYVPTSIKTAYSNAIPTVKNFRNNIQNQVQNQYSNVKNSFMNFKNNFRDGMNQTSNTNVSFVDGMKNAYQTYTDSKRFTSARPVNEDPQNISNVFQNDLGRAAGYAYSGAKSLGQNLKNNLQNRFNSIKSKLSQFNNTSPTNNITPST